MTSVLLVDDHELIRQGLCRAFEREGEDLCVVAQAGSVAEGLAAWRTARPDVVVTDLQMPDGTGLDIVRSIRAESESTGLVMLTMHTGDVQIFAAMEAGVSAFLNKEARASEVVGAARHAARAPRSFLCSGLAGAVMRRASTASSQLSPREQEILVLLADGLKASDIAQRLYLGESTVKTHIAHLYDKLGASNRAQVLVTAMRRGLLMETLTAAG
ncbi:response regulator transcription factor [Nocardioides koreensis]|uniref:Response regulator transcription factor n=1 Tax=Nocardioides koreensis TaxID=433651 RepID=A0ABN2ZZ93_9ACTN